MRLGIRAQLTGAIGALVALLAGLSFALLPARLEREAERAYEQRTADLAAVVAASVAPGVEFEDHAGTEAALARLSRAHDVAFAVVERDGAVFAAWELAARPAEPVGIAEAAGRGLELATLSVPLKAEDPALGRLVLGVSLAPLERERAEAVRLVSLVSALLFAVGLLLAWVLGTLLSRPILALARVAERIAKDGDLSQEIDTSRGDELGQLARAFALVVERLRGLPVRLSESTRLLAEAVARLRQAADAHNDMLVRQAAALRETQVTAEQMRQSSTVAAERAAGVLREADRAENLSKSGAQAVEASLGGMNELKAQALELARQVTALGERARLVASITEKVKGIADQTNMLALNAAIEAVRSGEQGKGFAVVAREMRTLADKSIAATNEVRRILEDIGLAIEETVQMAVDGGGRVTSGFGQITTSGETIRELSGIVAVNASSARQIAAAVSQQHQGVGQISSAMNDLGRMMSETISQLEQTRSAIDLLGSAAENVDAVVGGFRV